jgi:hypothetical protein
MNTISERLARCHHETLLAASETLQPHTEAEHACMLLLKVDREIERNNIVGELVMQAAV